MSNNAIALPQAHKSSRGDVIALIRQTLYVMARAGDALELRIPNMQGRRTDSGYFDDFDKLAECAANYDGHVEGIYITVNPVDPLLLARSNNHVRQYAKQTTSEKDVMRRRWIFVDFDPIRPTGISASDSENTKALDKARSCRAQLAHHNISAVLANSGNGAHLLIPVDLPNDADTTALVKNFFSLVG